MRRRRFTGLNKLDGKRSLNPGDIRDARYSRQLVQIAEKELGGLDIVVNNTAFQRTYKKITDVPAEEFATTFQTNVFGTFYRSQASLPKLRKGGSIINTCSIQADEPSAELVAYAPTKAALVSLTKVLPKAGAEQGVRVNGVAPGPVWTPLIPSTMPQEKVKTFGKNTVFERSAQPTELAPIYGLPCVRKTPLTSAAKFTARPAGVRRTEIRRAFHLEILSLQNRAIPGYYTCRRHTLLIGWKGTNDQANSSCDGSRDGQSLWRPEADRSRWPQWRNPDGLLDLRRHARGVR